MRRRRGPEDEELKTLEDDEETKKFEDEKKRRHRGLKMRR